jgi:hypothetical protein
MAYIGAQPSFGNFQTCDAISVVNGQAAYTLQVGGVNISPQSAQHCLVSLNGVLQAPISSYTISSSTLTFAANLATGDVIDFVTILGDTLDLGVPSDSTVTAAKLNNDIISGTTALTVSPAATDEILLSDAGTLKRTDVSVFGNAPAFKVTLSGNQTIAHDTLTRVTFDTEEYDTHSAFASNIFTVPTNEGGKYFFEFHTLVDDMDDADSALMYIELDGTKVVGSLEQKYGSGGTQNITLNWGGVITVTAGQTVEVVIKHLQGGNQDLRSADTYFAGHKMIGL